MLLSLFPTNYSLVERQSPLLPHLPLPLPLLPHLLVLNDGPIMYGDDDCCCDGVKTDRGGTSSAFIIGDASGNCFNI